MCEEKAARVCGGAVSVADHSRACRQDGLPQPLPQLQHAKRVSGANDVFWDAAAMR